ncbi:hypothetical protein [Pedobacter frigidisoli]|uniref:hypothetical protein n=1 Tax=Pedobacter frigidisoli TaxID=2530455 RepID=UPI00292D4799|nr:hypothetical protein [Pedobacter frigidisoli]
MLSNNSIIEYFRYDINLLKPVQFVCQLAFDISKISDSTFDLVTLFDPAFVDEINIDFSLLPENISEPDKIAWIANEIATFHNRGIITRLDLTRSQILLLHQPSRLIYVLNKSKRVISAKERTEEENKKINTKNALVSAIKDQRIVRQIIDRIQNVTIRECILKSISIEFEEIYQNCVIINDAVPLQVPYLSFSYLDPHLINEDIIDITDIWVNKERFKSAFGIEIGEEQNISAVNLVADSSEIGVKYNDYFFPILQKLDLYIDTPSKIEFHWIQVKEVFKLNDINKNHYQSSLINEFKTKIKRKDFTALLSNLQENLYLETALLTGKPSYKKYFTNTLKISQIKYLKQFNFFISDSEDSTALGIYSFEKIGEDATHFNLLHWYDKTAGQQKRYRDNSGPGRVEKNDALSVSALQPELSFYFITKYFEDFLDTLFTEMDFQFISNFHLRQGSTALGEFDFLIKHKNKFFFVEAKTTLTKFYIKDYQKKCQKIIRAFSDIDVELEFLIVGAYSNTTVEDLRVYIDNSHKGMKRYNSDNPDLAVRPYLFNVPIENSSKQISCIAEPNYTNLKNIIKKICLK